MNVSRRHSDEQTVMVSSSTAGGGITPPSGSFLNLQSQMPFSYLQQVRKPEAFFLHPKNPKETPCFLSLFEGSSRVSGVTRVGVGDFESFMCDSVSIGES